MSLPTEAILGKYMVRIEVVFLRNIFREQYLEGCEWLKFLLSIGI